MEGRGSKRIFFCRGKRKKKAERIDNRIHNGGGQLVGEYELSSLVINYLLKNDNKVKPMSANRWLIELELVDSKLLSALYRVKCFKVMNQYAQVKHIDLIGRSISVYMQKQNEWKVKRLTLEGVNAVKAYIKEYGLEVDHYIVGQVDKHGNYKSSCISDAAYRKAIHKWLGFAPYTLRKTQVTAMHEAGADIATIAKQSGHKSLETITKHYLEVHDTIVDKYL